LNSQLKHAIANCCCHVTNSSERFRVVPNYFGPSYFNLYPPNQLLLYRISVLLAVTLKKSPNFAIALVHENVSQQPRGRDWETGHSNALFPIF